jgi:hypothetical protein
MRTKAKLGVNFYTQVSPDTDRRRRRLQEELGLTVRELVDKALRCLENQVQSRQGTQEAA